MADMDGTDHDALFELMMSGAGMIDIPVHYDPIAACDVMVPTSAIAPDNGSPTAWTVVCGYGNAIIPVDDEWRGIVVVEVMATPDVIEAFGNGPGAFIETTWMREAIGDDDVLSFVIATWDESRASTRRFGVRIPPFVECDYLADAAVFALSLAVLTDAEDTDDELVLEAEVLSWFVENDPTMWARV